MNRRLSHVLLCTIIVATSLLALPHRVNAKGPAARITITGPGLTGEVVIEDRATLDTLSMAALEDFLAPLTDIPENLGPGYELTRFYQDDNGSYIPFDRVMYYPDRSGQGGYVLYEGIVNGWSGNDGRWFPARPASDVVMRRVLADHGVVLPVNEISVQPMLLLAQSPATLHLVDPMSLEDQTAWAVGGEWQVLSDAMSDPEGRVLYYAGVDRNGLTFQRVLDLTTGVDCLLAQQSQVVMVADDHTLLVENGGPVTASRTGAWQPSLEIRDAATFAVQQAIALPDDGPNRAYFPSPDRHWLLLLEFGGDKAVVHLFNVYTREFVGQATVPGTPAQPFLRGMWDSGSAVFNLTDGEHFYRLDVLKRSWIAIGGLYDMQRRAKLISEGTWFEFGAARNGHSYLYHPLGRYWLYDYQAEDQGQIDGGIFVVNRSTVAVNNRWQPDSKFAQVIYQAERLYALEAPRDSDAADLIALDSGYGSVLGRRALEPGTWFLARVWVASDALKPAATPATASACDRPEPERLPVPPITPPPTATPR
jgi:hypothetical protein